MPYTQALCIFVIMVLHEAQIMAYDDYSHKISNVNLYLQTIMTLSFLSAMWGLFLIMDLTAKFHIIQGHKFKLKAAILKIIVVFVNLQGLIINILDSFEIIDCKGSIGSLGISGLLNSLCSLIEAFILGQVCFALNVRHSYHH